MLAWKSGLRFWILKILKMPKVPIFRCPKMGLRAPESISGNVRILEAPIAATPPLVYSVYCLVCSVQCSLPCMVCSLQDAVRRVRQLKGLQLNHFAISCVRTSESGVILSLTTMMMHGIYKDNLSSQDHIF